MSYTRVLPRDLFNESKLLKCLGQLALNVHDGCAGSLEVKHTGAPFHIKQDPSDGSFYEAGIEWYCWIPVPPPKLLGSLDRVFSRSWRMPLFFRAPLNSRVSYHLYVTYKDDTGDHELAVFEEDGTMTHEFCELITRVPKPPNGINLDVY
jgi:hypothetical protein